MEWSVISNMQTEYFKRYYDMVFPKTLKENEYICLFLVKTDNEGNVLLDKDGNEIKFHRFVKNFEQYKEHVNQYKYNFHVYNAIATVKKDKNGELHRREANMRQQRVLFIDFDKKDYPNLTDAHDFTKLIKDKLPDMFLHAYYDSGHGYHYYVMIPPTCKIRELSEFNKEICSLVGADTNACKVTQVARIPCTYNRKYLDVKGRFPLVKEIDHYQKNPYAVKHWHPCNVDYIKRRAANARKIMGCTLESKPLERWDYAGDSCWEIPVYPCLCTEKILREGADKGERNTWLGRIISMLRFNSGTEEKIREICLEWNTRCRPPKSPSEVRKEINTYLDKEDMYKLNGCWNKITDSRVSEIVHAQCDKFHCMQAIQKKNISIEQDVGVKMSQKLLTDGRLRNDREVSLSGYEFLVMTILYKYMKSGSRIPFTVKELKMKMQWKKSGKWKLCMDLKTFKSTLEKLVEHRCIEMVEPTPEQCGKKKVTYDDTKIKIKRGLKELDDRYIEFYYSVARAVISKQITQNEFKVFLCIVNNKKEGKSCTMENLDKILCIGRTHIWDAIQNLQKAQCIEVVQYRSDKGKWYNLYNQTHTNKYDDVTFNDDVNNGMDIKIDTPNDNVTSVDANNGVVVKMEDELKVRLLV